MPQLKEMSLKCGQLRAFPVGRGGGMGIAGQEADLLNLAVGPVGCWRYGGTILEGVDYERGYGSCTLAGRGCLGEF